MTYFCHHKNENNFVLLIQILYLAITWTRENASLSWSSPSSGSQFCSWLKTWHIFIEYKTYRYVVYPILNTLSSSSSSKESGDKDSRYLQSGGLTPIVSVSLYAVCVLSLVYYDRVIVECGNIWSLWCWLSFLYQ